MVRLLAFDLDGTTITEHKNLSPENRDALIAAGQRGVYLVPATGRMRWFVPEEVTSLPGVRYCITSNGAAVYDLQNNQVVHSALIPNKKALQVQNLMDGYQVYLEYYCDGRAITQKGYPEMAFTRFGIPESRRIFIDGKDYSFTDDFARMLKTTGLCPEKINMPYLPENVRQEIWDRLADLDGLVLTSSLPGNLELNAQGADKGAALMALAERLGIEREEVMAIGDNGNDVTMLESAGISVAVADGTTAALAAAGYRTAAHDQDGVAHAVKRFILS